ncbi:hypothetical protein ElyMa_003954700 [Elysia marginata]|uniref:FAS1 domain-containing protein n=1 Tax=Elysia marginata TaxID=1093978 RepID=A0AAV4FW14_9GAST|nr:hypothetical protein ElyMa_003954700 [Elysia marginata]
MVLEPFLPDDNTPSIETALETNPAYSIFNDLIKGTSVLEELDQMNEFTVFVPTNDAFGPINQHLVSSAILSSSSLLCLCPPCPQR